MYIISACLLGENCKYKGGNNFCAWVEEFAKSHSFLAVCPEVQAGMPTPRPPAEISGERVINSKGEDVTERFVRGAKECWELAQQAARSRKEPVEGAILKANSPSCGKDRVYDGTFSGTLTDGDGYFVRLLKIENIDVITEKENKVNGEL